MAKGWTDESMRHQMSAYGIPTGRNKVRIVLKEFKAGKLHSGKSGKIVTNPKQALAIGLSEQRKELSIDYSKLDDPIVEKPRTMLPALDAQIMRIESPYKESDFWHAEVSLYESLGEMGENYTFDYDSKPTVEEIKKDTKKYLLDEKKRFNNSIIGAREENYLKAIRKLKL